MTTEFLYLRTIEVRLRIVPQVLLGQLAVMDHVRKGSGIRAADAGGRSGHAGGGAGPLLPAVGHGDLPESHLRAMRILHACIIGTSILPPPPRVRAPFTSPPCGCWYRKRGYGIRTWENVRFWFVVERIRGVVPVWGLFAGMALSRGPAFFAHARASQVDVNLRNKYP